VRKKISYEIIRFNIKESISSVKTRFQISITVINIFWRIFSGKISAVFSELQIDSE
jgi:hypothetical protein